MKQPSHELFQYSHYSKKMVTFLLLIFFMHNLASCNKKSKTDTGTSKNKTETGISSFPAGFAIASLTAASSSSQILLSKHKKIISNLRGKKIIFNAETDVLDPSADFDTKEQIFTQVASAKKASSCKVTIPDFTTSVTEPTCYGPQLDYVGHLDFVSGGNESGQLPSGDLGIWSATESNGTACSAAKMNNEITKVSYKVDAALMVVASINCVINTTSLTLPNENESIDIRTELQDALSENNNGISFSVATVERLADIRNLPVYLYTLEFNQNSSLVNLYIQHHATNSTYTNYIGKIWANFAGNMPGGAGSSYAFSLLYNKDEDNLKYQMLGTNYTTASNNIFTENHDVDITETWGGNFSQTIANIDVTTGLGSLSYAWQAGYGDDSTRVFNSYVTKNGNNIVGYGYFGFGDKINTSGVIADNSIQKFICNWAGPSASHTGIASRAQKQSMIYNDGKFIPNSAVADPNEISYAPVNSCSMTTGQTNTNAIAFKYKLPTVGSYPTTQPAVTSELVDLDSDTEYSDYVAPRLPDDF